MVSPCQSRPRRQNCRSFGRCGCRLRRRSEPGVASWPEFDAHRLALTGARAAARIGLPVLTSRPQYLYRVDAEGDEFERVPSEIGGFRTDRGANVALISDPGRLALTDARRLGRGLVAPPSRVMLDLFLEPRGDAAVDAF